MSSLAAQLKAGCRTVFISSAGGDVFEALTAGRLIRHYKAGVTVPRGGICASSCVFLYAAGVQRAPFGPVQIHRPYHPQAVSSFVQEQQRYDRLAAEIRKYLKSMNVRDTLFDEMMKVPPETSRSLTLDEMESFGLTYVDPVYSEYLDSMSAARMGLSKQEFLRQKSAATKACGTLEGVIPAGVDVERRLACWKARMPKYYEEAASN